MHDRTYRSAVTHSKNGHAWRCFTPLSSDYIRTHWTWRQLANTIIPYNKCSFPLTISTWFITNSASSKRSELITAWPILLEHGFYPTMASCEAVTLNITWSRRIVGGRSIGRQGEGLITVSHPLARHAAEIRDQLKRPNTPSIKSQTGENQRRPDK